MPVTEMRLHRPHLRFRGDSSDIRQPFPLPEHVGRVDEHIRRRVRKKGDSGVDSFGNGGGDGGGVSDGDGGGGGGGDSECDGSEGGGAGSDGDGGGGGGGVSEGDGGGGRTDASSIMEVK